MKDGLSLDIIWSFPVDRILEPKFSFRRNVDESVGDLVGEIKASGMVIEPIVCRPSSKPGYVELGPGERRLRAAKKLGMKTVPVIVRDLGDAEFDRILLLENLARKDLSDVEIGHVLKYILDLYYEEQKGKYEVFRDKLVPKRAVKAIVDLYMDIDDDPIFLET